MAESPASELVLTIESRPPAGGCSPPRRACDPRVGAIPANVSGPASSARRRAWSYAEPSSRGGEPDRRSTTTSTVRWQRLRAHPADRQVTLKGEVLADALTRIGRLTVASPIPVTPSPERGYRMRARLHARRGELGFIREERTTCATRLPPGNCCRRPVFWRAAGAGAARRRLDEVTGIEIAEDLHGRARWRTSNWGRRRNRIGSPRLPISKA